jgi:hypothetical protein
MQKTGKTLVVFFLSVVLGVMTCLWHSAFGQYGDRSPACASQSGACTGYCQPPGVCHRASQGGTCVCM